MANDPKDSDSTSPIPGTIYLVMIPRAASFGFENAFQLLRSDNLEFEKDPDSAYTWRIKSNDFERVVLKVGTALSRYDFILVEGKREKPRFFTRDDQLARSLDPILQDEAQHRWGTILGRAEQTFGRRYKGSPPPKTSE